MSNRAAQLDAETKQRHPGATMKRRGRNFIEHDLGNGVTRWTGTIEPLHTRAGAPIDTAWIADASPWSYRVSAADYTSRIKAAFNGAPLLQYTDATSGAWVTLQPQQLNWTNDSNSVQMISAVQVVTAQLSDDLVRWPGAYGAGRDFEYVNHPKRLIKRLVLAEALPTPSAAILSGANPALQLQFIFDWSSDATVYIDGAAWDKKAAKITAGNIEFRVGSATVFWMDAPTAFDSSAEPDYAPGVVLRVRKAGNNLYVEVRVPYAWLQGAVYPVVIDPTLTLDDGEAGINTDCSLMSGYPNYNTGINLQWGVGKRNHIGNQYRSLLKFDVSSIPASATCDSATLSITPTADNADTTSTLAAYRMIRAWAEGTKEYTDVGADGASWNTYDGSNAWGTAGAANTSSDREASNIGTRAMSASETVGTAIDLALTAAGVQDWWDGGLTNNGLLLQNSENSYDQYFYASSDHATTGYRPKLVVDYTPVVTGSPWYAYAQQ